MRDRGGFAVALAIEIDRERIADFCRRWKITEFSFFGSVLRGDFSRESDVDVLVSFAPDSHWSLFDLMDMEDELAELFGRKVDLVSRNGLRNPFRRHEILRTRQVMYVA